MQLFSSAILYAAYDPKVPVYCVTPRREPVTHRYFDTSPISPSGRYLAVTTLPSQWRQPEPGTKASVDVIDLLTGERLFRSVTSAWDVKLGAQVQWGATDHDLFFNDMDEETWTPFGVSADPIEGTSHYLGNTVYMASPDGRFSLTPCLRRMSLVQPGHGVIVPDTDDLRYREVSDRDGVFVTDHESGHTGLLVSFADIVDAAPDSFARYISKTGGFYAAHVQWNPQQTRILLVMRWMPAHGGRGSGNTFLVTFDADGGNIRVALDARRWLSDHVHAHWARDGEHILVTLLSRTRGPTLRSIDQLLYGSSRFMQARTGINPGYIPQFTRPRFKLVRYDGGHLRILCPNSIGSGRASMGPDDHTILTDSDPDDPISPGDGTSLIRLIDLKHGLDHEVVCMRTETGSPRRKRPPVQPNPVWHRNGRHVVFNGNAAGVRQVFIADFARILAELFDVKARTWT